MLVPLSYTHIYTIECALQTYDMHYIYSHIADHTVYIIATAYAYITISCSTIY